MDSTSSSSRNQSYEETLSSILMNLPPQPPSPPPLPPPTSSSSSLFHDPTLPSRLPTYDSILLPINPNPNQTTQPSPPPPRPSKKRTRASRRAPTTVLTTDASNFRAMVQEFTGFPPPPSFFPRAAPYPPVASFLGINHPSSTMDTGGGGSCNAILAGLLRPQRFAHSILGTVPAGGPQELEDADGDGGGPASKRLRGGDAWSNTCSSD